MPPSLAEHLVLITGSSRGLGLAIARAFRAAGAKVILNYISASSKAAADSAADDLDAIAIQADVTSPSDMRALFDTAAHIYRRPISVVVNNALASFTFNGSARTPLSDITWSEFDAQLQGSLRGALNTAQSALPGFEQLGHGRIINIGSNLVQNPVVPYQDYTAGKGALLAFTRTSAAELGPKGVTVNMVSAGLLRVTDASRGTPEEVWERVREATPLGRVCGPEDVVGAVMFFASEWAGAVTGQNLGVDGGLVMG